MDIGQTEVAALETEGQLFVIEAEEVQNCRVDIVHVGAVGDGVEAEFVGLANHRAGLSAAAGEPHGEGVNVVVTAGGIAVLAHRGAAEFAAPDDKGVFEQAALFEIGDEGGLGLVDLATTGDKIDFEIFTWAAVAVPVGVIQLDKTRAPFDESACEQAVAGEGRRILFDAVELAGGLTFAAEIDEFRRARLHAAGHFIGGDARMNFGIAGGNRLLKVEVADGVDGLALAVGRDALGVGEIEDGVAVTAKRHALIGGRQEAGAPVDGPAARTARAGLEDDEAGEILRFAAKPVRDPGSHAGAAK